jgi:hypothetical protein
LGASRSARTLTACLAAVLIFAFTPLGGASAAAGVQPRIPKPVAVDAPTAEKGGVLNPFVSCTRYTVEPRVKWTLTRVKTGKSHTYRWTGALPGMYFPRVAVGRYRSKTTGRCRGNQLTRVHTVRVIQKTLGSTISRAEFKQVRRGMSRAKVGEVVGFDGKACWVYSGRTSCNYDMMSFWAWAMITYSDGRVVEKHWDVDHD